jgi:hypothetical protein
VNPAPAVGSAAGLGKGLKASRRDFLSLAPTGGSRREEGRKKTGRRPEEKRREEKKKTGSERKKKREEDKRTRCRPSTSS